MDEPVHVRLTVDDIHKVGPVGTVVPVIEGDVAVRVTVPSSSWSGTSSIPASTYEVVAADSP